VDAQWQRVKRRDLFHPSTTVWQVYGSCGITFGGIHVEATSSSGGLNQRSMRSLLVTAQRAMLETLDSYMRHFKL
jgi:hypothetical protein